MFFRGYVETKNKKSIEKIKNRTDFKTWEQVQSLPEFAGVLSDEAILIDIDSAHEAEILMDIVEDLQLNCRVYQTTRGSISSSRTLVLIDVEPERNLPAA